MTSGFCVIIPARLGSTRLPGKVLLDIAGKPLIQHVYESAIRSEADRVVIATDNPKVRAAADGFSAECVMTSPAHISGTDRLAEAVAILRLPGDSIVVNVQGDEYGLPPSLINQLAALLQENPDTSMATLCERITDREDRDNPAVVKVVFDQNSKAIYFSRHGIPWTREGAPDTAYRHIGLYAYRSGFLETFTALPACDLERQESLEQLRVLYYGHDILVAEACTGAGIGIDTEKDLERARSLADR